MKRKAERLGKKGADAVGGLREGIEKSLDLRADLSSDLKARGIELGEIILMSDSGAVDNKVSVYMIFNKDFTGDIRIRAIKNDKEIGRCVRTLSSKAGDARYEDFVFQKNTNIDRQYTVLKLE